MSFSETIQLARENPKATGLALLNLVPFVNVAVREVPALIYSHKARQLAREGRVHESLELRHQARMQHIMAVGLSCGSLFTGIGAAMTASWNGQPIEAVAKAIGHDPLAGALTMAIGTLFLNGHGAADVFHDLKRAKDALHARSERERLRALIHQGQDPAHTV